MLKDCVLHLQEEMARLQENLEKLKVQGSEYDSEEKVMLNETVQNSSQCYFFITPMLRI